MSTTVRGLVLLSMLAASLLTRPAHAQTAAVGQAASPSHAHARVLVMRDEDGPAGGFAPRAQRAVQRGLGELAFTVNPSPLPFRDAQLAAGCTGSVRACGAPVAAALESEELLVIRVEDDPNQRHATLTLLRFAPNAPARAGTAQLPRAPAEELAPSVRALLESLFSDRVQQNKVVRPAQPVPSEDVSMARERAPRAISAGQPAQASATPPESDYVARIARAQQRRRLLAIGWPTLTAGAGLMVGGLITNLAARRDGRAYESLAPSSREDVDAKLHHQRDAEDKLQTARILWGIGGGLAAAGMFVLLWERLSPAPDRKLHKALASGRERGRLRFAAAPLASGFALACAGEL